MDKLTGRLVTSKWEIDEYGALNLRFPGPFGEVHAFIQLRAPYCDRGRFQFGIMRGVPAIDHADSFPRYYMTLEAALQEAEAWLLWRLYKIDLAGFSPSAQLLLAANDARSAEFPAPEPAEDANVAPANDAR